MAMDGVSWIEREGVMSERGKRRESGLRNKDGDLQSERENPLREFYAKDA